MLMPMWNDDDFSQVMAARAPSDTFGDLIKQNLYFLMPVSVQSTGALPNF
jgi:hypothetical protein